MEASSFKCIFICFCFRFIKRDDNEANKANINIGQTFMVETDTY